MRPVTISIFAVTLAVYVAGNPMSLALWPVAGDQFRPYQLVSYALLHGNWLHLALNLLALLSFGFALERAWGPWRFLACYVLAAAFGGMAQSMMSDRPIMGASAALFGLFAAFVIHNPKARILTLFPWPLAAWKVLLAYVLLTGLALLFHWATNIAHLAHLGGMVVGILFAIDKKPRR